MQAIPFSIDKERLSIHWFKEVGPNLKTWGTDVKENYIDKPIEEGNALKAVLGAGMVVAEGVLRGPDMVFSGIVDQKKEAPSGLMGRTRQTTGQLLENVVTIHPIRALGNVSELAFSFPWALDIADATIFDRASASRSKVKAAMETDYATAA